MRTHTHINTYTHSQLGWRLAGRAQYVPMSGSNSGKIVRPPSQLEDMLSVTQVNLFPVTLNQALVSLGVDPLKPCHINLDGWTFREYQMISVEL